MIPFNYLYWRTSQFPVKTRGGIWVKDLQAVQLPNAVVLKGIVDDLEQTWDVDGKSISSAECDLFLNDDMWVDLFWDGEDIVTSSVYHSPELLDAAPSGKDYIGRFKLRP